ncbi:flagellar hook assembly protein FlgD [Arenibaculum pallidiluteum]|uniref:flagellar hook assembly protein FlgD n=1 Tax=Arenibaculum pallidiluteum TaxID=2812559 RepID=UPI001A978363|nr:flagellar hook assembly protein FlgD [Arenibaculum pallidiluteum]
MISSTTSPSGAAGSGGAGLGAEQKTDASATSAGLTGAAKASVDYQSFLNLLTAQLKNQDPLAPLDGTQFVTQLAQFSSVEQAVQSNQRMAELLEAMKASGARLDMAYLGRSVQAETDVFGLSGGKAEAVYVLEGEATKVSIDILDAGGKVVRTLPGETASGKHTLSWDGRRADGTQLPDGAYQMKVTAVGKDKRPVSTATVVTDTVAEVRYIDGGTVFVLKGGAQVSGGQILSAS